MLISLHFPKTAGTSFSASLEEYFGSTLVKDYDDRPINTPKLERVLKATRSSISNYNRNFQDIECIHGHFLPLKYLMSSYRNDVQFITWMRNPVDRLFSHYNYWYESYDPNFSASLHKKVVEEAWSLERFCFSKELRNLYSQFLFGFSLERFSFIGITENYEADFNYFSKNYLTEDLEAYRVNETTKKPTEMFHDKSFVRSVESYHALDVELYNRAVRMSRTRPET